MWSDFNNSFTFARSDELRKRQKQTLPPHLLSVATLPCEISMPNRAPLQQLFRIKIIKWEIVIYSECSPWLLFLLLMCLFPKCLPSASPGTSSRVRHWSTDGVNDALFTMLRQTFSRRRHKICTSRWIIIFYFFIWKNTLYETNGNNKPNGQPKNPRIITAGCLQLLT